MTGAGTPPGIRQGVAVRAGFTFIEVICVLMIVGIGMLSVVGVTAYGLMTASKSQGEITGLATAMSVAADPQPFVPAEVAGDWTYTPYSMNGTGTLTSTARGYLNGFYTVRTETSSDADIVAVDPSGMVYVRSAEVSVDVYDTIKGNVVASYSTRITRQRPAPPGATP
jgi:prepilin-type N-terminal cleavage/methylation domain-containing protein